MLSAKSDTEIVLLRGLSPLSAIWLKHSKIASTPVLFV